MADEQTPGKRYAVSNLADNPQATARKSLPLPCLTLVTEPNPNLLSIVKEAVAGGVDLVQLREKPPFSREAFNVAWDISEVTLGRALLIINGCVGLVRKVGADGFHLPEVSLFSVTGTRLLTGQGLVGRSVHLVEQAKQAVEEGIDYLVAGMIFASHNSPDAAPQGLDFLREVCTAVSIPVLAIGGVTPENTAECIAAGAAGVAVLSPIMRASNPRAVAQSYRSALDAAWEEKRV